MVRHIEERKKVDKSNLIQIEVFKPTCGNDTKRLKLWQKTPIFKNTKATWKQIAT